MSDLKTLVEKLMQQCDLCDFQTPDGIHQLKMNRAYCELKDYFEYKGEPRVLKTVTLTPKQKKLLLEQGSMLDEGPGGYQYWYHPKVSENIFRCWEGKFCRETPVEMSVDDIEADVTRMDMKNLIERHHRIDKENKK